MTMMRPEDVNPGLFLIPSVRWNLRWIFRQKLHTRLRTRLEPIRTPKYRVVSETVNLFKNRLYYLLFARRASYGVDLLFFSYLLATGWLES